MFRFLIFVFNYAALLLGINTSKFALDCVEFKVCCRKALGNTVKEKM